MLEQPPTINCETTKQTLCAFIRNETQNAGVENIVIGMSGGVDSAVSCALAAEALGADRVIGVQMPYKTSLDESSQHAKLVIDTFGVKSINIEITDMVDAYFNTVDTSDQTRRGNVLARSRMIVLYDLSAAYNAFVLGTGNKTELLLGYTTIWGDSACAVNPLGDLYKTQVWQLARSLGVPDIVIEKPPTADLWEGQTDENDLGFSYRDADMVLYNLVDCGCDRERMIKDGIDPDLIDRIVGRMKLTEFKRRMPLTARLCCDEQCQCDKGA